MILCHQIDATRALRTIGQFNRTIAFHRRYSTNIAGIRYLRSQVDKYQA